MLQVIRILVTQNPSSIELVVACLLSPVTASINIIISNTIFYVTLLLVNQLLRSTETLTSVNSVKV